MTNNSKHWQLLRLFADYQTQEIVSAFLQEYCLGLIPLDDHSELFFASENQAQIENLLQELSHDHKFKWSWQQVEQEPWHLAWKDNFVPIAINDKILIVPDWDDENTAEILIRIRPGMAFGTGHHETTYLILQALIKYLQPGMTVLDVGSGSGILTIAAQKLGSGKIQCIEFDPTTKENFYENLELNDLEDGISLTFSDVLQWNNFSQDIILANVNRAVITELIPKLQNSKGIIILSGILKTDENKIIKKCENHRLKIMEINQKGEWICLVVRKVI